MNKKIIINPRKKELSSELLKAVILFIIDNSTVVDNIRVAYRGAYAAAAKFFNESRPIIIKDSILL
jgi:hypothetical protein